MIRINEGSFVPKYKAGKWVWSDAEDRLVFQAHTEAQREEVIHTAGFRFNGKLNQLDEMIFRQEFQRSELTHDNDVILIQDILNLVLYLSPSEIVTKEFISFVHTRVIHKFLHALVIYFEHYLKLVEFLLIRRDEITGEKSQLQSQESVEIKRIYSAQLSQYRLLLAREYSLILLGEGEMKPHYHITPIVNISMSIKDQRFHEGFLAFSTQFVWIAMHRRAYEYIDLEMNRLFRSEHFTLPIYENKTFTKVETDMLHGKNYRRVNYRVQTSPLIQELGNVAVENQAILWIGERKYRGTDPRIHELELEFIVPGSQLVLIDVTHGILGHPKKLYNTLLNIEWEAVRKENYSEFYDPYGLINQPYLKIPNIDAESMRKKCEKFEHYYRVESYIEIGTKEILRKWKRRDKIIDYFKNEGMITSVWNKCEYEVTRGTYGPSVSEIRDRFLTAKKKLRKK